MPVACMWAYMMVEPVNLKPRCFRSLENASDSLEVDGTWSTDVKVLTFWRPSTNCQAYWSNEPNLVWMSRKIRALFTAAFILSLLRIMAGFCSSSAMVSGVNRATYRGSNPANAFL